jgi:hypothetical protein
MMDAQGCTAMTNVTCATGLVCERSPSACVDPTWAEWPMPNAPADVSAGAPNLAAYTDNGDGTVTDKVTGLMWQQAVTAAPYSWSDARSQCSTVSLGGHADWRLPSRIELLSLVDLGASGTATNVTYFPGIPAAPAAVFWTSSPLANNPSAAWTVDFSYGAISYADVTHLYDLRCVR